MRNVPSFLRSSGTGAVVFLLLAGMAASASAVSAPGPASGVSALQASGPSSRTASSSASPAKSSSQPGLLQNGNLDLKRLKAAYVEGDFDFLTEVLEPYLRRTDKHNGNRSILSDRIFAYKYLSVIYAASPETKSKAESYMYQLLTLAPSIDIVDLYVPESIDALFRKVKADYERRNAYSQGYDEFGQPLASSSSTRPADASPSGSSSAAGSAKRTGGKEDGSGPGKKKGHSLLWWGAGATALVAGGVAVFLLLPDEKGSKSPVDSNLNVQ